MKPYFLKHCSIIFQMLVLSLVLYSCSKSGAIPSSTGSNDHDSTVHDTAAYADENDTAFERGGSNYSFYSVGTYFDFPTDSVWYIPYNMRPVIGTYHLAPDTVRKELSIMYANGQRKIALNLWYSDLSADGNLADSAVYGHLVNSKLGRLLPQHESNLKSLLNDIVAQGFNEIVFRFATQGDSDPRGWGAWDESKYLNNWSFIENTITTIEDQLKDKPVKIFYDLDMELGGLEEGQSIQYATRLWKDYTDIFGTHHTVGFSFAVASGRLTEAISVFDKAGKRPDLYAFDIYGDEFNTFSYLKNELEAAGEASKPMIAEEVYYNDPETFAQIIESRNMLHLNIKYLLQWDLARGTPNNKFAAQYPADFSAYLN
jgi:hypothetical protein